MEINAGFEVQATIATTSTTSTPTTSTKISLFDDNDGTIIYNSTTNVTDPKNNYGISSLGVLGDVGVEVIL